MTRSNYSVKTFEEAWKKANEIFPGDYEYDEKLSLEAAYDVYHSTTGGVEAWIEDEGDRLVLTLPNKKEISVWIEANRWATGEPTVIEMIKGIRDKVEQIKARSAWDKGVKVYALEMLEEMAFNAEHGYIDADAFSNRKMLRDTLLNGAGSWSEYSWGGCSLIYDGDIAERLCNPTELKRTKNGERNPNSREGWLDVQARALGQACNMILDKSGVPSSRSWEAARTARA